jgi:hypothetical protein
VIYVQQMSGIVMPQPRWRLPSRQPRTGDWLPAVSLCIDDFTSCASSSQNWEHSPLGSWLQKRALQWTDCPINHYQVAAARFSSQGKVAPGSWQVLYSYINDINCHMTATLPR